MLISVIVLQGGKQFYQMETDVSLLICIKRINELLGSILVCVFVYGNVYVIYSYILNPF